MNRKRVYFNQKQLLFLNGHQPIKTFVGSRATGKTTVMSGEDVCRMKEMPRAKFAMSSSTYNQLSTKTIPALIEGWERIGLVEDRDYVVGKKPPKNFDKCYAPPKKYENIISFKNGYTKELLSMDRPDLARGGSYQGLDVDEAAWVKENDLNTVLIPSIRGGAAYFEGKRYYRNFCKYSSMPHKPSGFYLLDDEDKAKEEPNKFLYIESNSYDNVHVLGEETIELWRSTMSPLSFDIEVMNKRVTSAEEQFYYRFNAEKHSYTSQYIYDVGIRGYETKGINDKYYNPSQRIDIGLDFGGWFKPLLAFQKHADTEYVIDYLFEKTDGDLQSLINRFCIKYKAHQHKVVHVYGEPRGHDKRADGPDLYELVKKYFRANGWVCEIKASAGRTNSHKERYEFLNEVLSELNKTLPRLRINDINCKDLIIAMQLAAVLSNMEKDKSSEKDRNFAQQHATHCTDIIDYFFMQKYFIKFKTGGRTRPGRARVA